MSQTNVSFMSKIENAWYIFTELIHLIKQDIDFQSLMAKIGAGVTYIMTYAFDIKQMIPSDFLTSVQVGDEILIGLIRTFFAVLTALVIMFLTDVYKTFRESFKDKLKQFKKQTESNPD